MLLKTMLLNLRLHLTLLQLQLQLKPMNTPSKHIPPESLLQDVEPILITESSQSDMELKMDKITSLLKTHGEPHGEIKDTSKLELPMSAVSS